MGVISRTADGTIHGEKDSKDTKKPASTGSGSQSTEKKGS